MEDLVDSISAHRAAQPPLSRKQQTVKARACLMKSDAQERLGALGGFVWHVERWPNWLQISVDALGNSSPDPHVNRQVADRWCEENKDQLNQIFAEIFGEEFGELAILGRSLGPEPHTGNCCRTGCAGCLNGPRERMVEKLKEPAGPVDTVG